MKTRTVVALGSVFFAFALCVSVRADMISVSFSRVTSNSSTDISSQLGLAIYDSAGAASAYGVVIGSDQVLMVVTNDVGTASSISEIYIDDNSVPQKINPPVTVINSLSGFTDFSAGGAVPGNLPGGETLSPEFEAIAVLSADAQGNPANGVDTSSDALGLVYSLDGSFADFAAAVEDGTIRFGYHVRAIGPDGQSDAFVSGGGGGTPVPEPATVLLFGLGVVGAGLLRRRRTVGKAVNG